MKKNEYILYNLHTINSHNTSMGCDYYIVKSLLINYATADEEYYFYIEIDRAGNYFLTFSQDDDDADEQIDRCLKANPPIDIYANGQFIKQKYEEKYKELINREINETHHSCPSFASITKIKLIESRFMM